MKFLLMLFPALALMNARAQTDLLFSSPRWRITGDTASREQYQDKSCLKLVNGKALLADAHFTNGIIEFDIAIPKARCFPGIRFRVQDTVNSEYYYIRPHQSGNPDAQQYVPEYNNAGNWQLYYGEGYNKAHQLPFERWLHIKMLISGTRAEIYLDNEQQPALYVHALKRPVKEGMIELQNMSPETVRFAGFRYTATDAVTLQNTPKTVAPPPPGTVRQWEVSDAFSESAVKDKPTLTPPPGLQWHTLDTDERGIADIARVLGSARLKNTTFCRLIINSGKDEIRKLSFGFSDRARVYLNKQLLYAGEDVFMSRDYRFLGTIGLWDAVYLPLKKGKNEICIAISEDFGGWGLMARLDSL